MSKRIIKLRGRELYFGPDGKWSSDVRQAHSFETLSEIGEAIEVYRLRDFEFAFSSAEEDMTACKTQPAACIKLTGEAL